jgi:hypothetical protein
MKDRSLRQLHMERIPVWELPQAGIFYRNEMLVDCKSPPLRS